MFVSFNGAAKGGVRMVRQLHVGWSLPVDIGHAQLFSCHSAGTNGFLNVLNVIVGCGRSGIRYPIDGSSTIR
jgi:hypothetical protein